MEQKDKDILKSIMRYGLDKQGMTYKEMNYKASNFFNK